jgi:hypothetical protein
LKREKKARPASISTVNDARFILRFYGSKRRDFL